MRTVAKVGTLCVLIAALAGGCGFGGDDQESDATRRYYELAAAHPEAPPLCQWIASQLAGREGTFFKLRFSDSFVALSSGGEVLCMDEPLVILRAGVIPVDNVDEPACDGCDGTPLPAEYIIDLARKYGEVRTEL